MASTRVEVTATIKPGRLADAIADMETVNKILERLSGIRGQMFLDSYSPRTFGGARLTFDWPSAEAIGHFEDVSAGDEDFRQLMARILGPDSPWVTPAERLMLTQVI